MRHTSARRTRRHAGSSRRRLLLPGALGAAAVALLVAAAVARLGGGPGATTEASPSPTPGASTASRATTSPTPGADPADPDAPLPGPVLGAVATVPGAQRPTRITIPSIDVDARMTDLGLNPDGTTEVPADAREVGWVETTPAPGEQGPAVVAAHVDSTSGPAVFSRLSSLRAGDEVEVTRADGSTVRFTVDGLRQYAQDDFPTASVYGPVPGPALRLVTCGGAYDESHGGYQDNVVVYAS